MARKFSRELLLCLTGLAILPGCQHIFPQAGGTGASDDARVRRDLVAAKGTTSTPIDGGSETAQKTGTTKTFLPNEQLPPKRPFEPERIPDPPSFAGPKSSEPIKGPTVEAPIEKQTIEFDPPAYVQSTKNETPIQKPVAFQQNMLPPIPLVDPNPKKRTYAPFVEAIQSILEDRHQEAIRHLEAYDKDTQEFFLRFCPTLTIFAKKRIDELSPAEVANLNDQLIGLLVSLRSRSELSINKMCYCSKIRTYGDYDSLPDKHAFLAGSKDRLGELVQLYVELRNFASEPTPDAEYLTKLVCTLELRDARGERVWSHTYDRNLTTYLRKTRLNDFYSNYRFYVPAIPPGEYQLTIQVADETNSERRRMVEKKLDFRVTPISGPSSLR